MSLGAEAWWFAMLGADQFEDGSLVIEDDTLDVDGGSTVNLRVKLGARPRDDVTVALSETSSLISLGSASLTFTQADWDTYQTVTVTAAGNRQTLQIPSGQWLQSGFERGWSYPSGQPAIVSGLTGGTSRTFRLFFVGVVGRKVNLQFGSLFNQDLSDTFEANGGVDVTVGDQSWSFELAGADTTEPYQWEPSNLGDLTSLYNTIDSAVAASLVLRDYQREDAIISLSASGPDEYSGVTGSATVTVN